MLTGFNARNYRDTISGVPISEMSEFLNEDTINLIESDNGMSVPADTIQLYYWAVNRIKLNRTQTKPEPPVGAEDPKPKTARKRQPKQPKNA